MNFFLVNKQLQSQKTIFNAYTGILWDCDMLLTFMRHAGSVGTVHIRLDAFLCDTMDHRL